jgi:hypothetical protein
VRQNRVLNIQQNHLEFLGAGLLTPSVRAFALANSSAGVLGLWIYAIISTGFDGGSILQFSVPFHSKMDESTSLEPGVLEAWQVPALWFGGRGVN